MNPEVYQILIMTTYACLFALGGTELTHKVKGHKWIRRFLLPVVIAFTVYQTGMEPWRCLCFWGTQTAALHLGYGQSLPYWRKLLTAIAYTLPSLFFGFTVWQFIAPVVFIALFALSNWKFTANIFKWKYCEFLMGAYLGITIADLVRMTYV